MPEQPLLATDLPVPNGFTWFPFSVWSGGVSPYGCGIRAFSWHVSAPLAASRQLRLVIYFDRDNWKLDAGGAELPWPLFPARWQLWTFGSGFHSELVRHDPDDGAVIVPDWLRRVRRLCQTFWSILGEPYIAARGDRAPRPARRRAAAAGMTSTGEVRVLDLRRARGPAGDVGSRSVPWSKRWVVAAHWRNQWYPSLGVHRQRYILPYVKGPPDKPLDVRSTVRALRR